jgi:hypothetical protein
LPECTLSRLYLGEPRREKNVGVVVHNKQKVNLITFPRQKSYANKVERIKFHLKKLLEQPMCLCGCSQFFSNLKKQIVEITVDFLWLIHDNLGVISIFFQTLEHMETPAYPLLGESC